MGSGCGVVGLAIDDDGKPVVDESDVNFLHLEHRFHDTF